MAGPYKPNPSGIATGQATVGTTATLIAAARPERERIVLTAVAATAFYVGGSGVTTGTGVFVPAGASLPLETTAAIYGVVPAATLGVSFIEEF